MSFISAVGPNEEMHKLFSSSLKPVSLTEVLIGFFCDSYFPAEPLCVRFSLCRAVICSVTVFHVISDRRIEAVSP